MAGGTRRLPGRPSSVIAMWMLITSDGRRLANIGCEEDARRTVHALGTTQLRGPYSWDVVDDQGRRFVAEIRRRIATRRP
jgi:hypothetical protein